jgi:hypothetical protein
MRMLSRTARVAVFPARSGSKRSREKIFASSETRDRPLLAA